MAFFFIFYLSRLRGKRVGWVVECVPRGEGTRGSGVKRDGRDWKCIFPLAPPSVGRSKFSKWTGTYTSMLLLYSALNFSAFNDESH